MNNNTEVGEQPQVKVRNEASGRTRSQNLRIVYAPGTPFAVRAVMGVIGRITGQDIHIFVMPEKYLARPINSGFVRKLSQTPAAGTFVIAYDNRSFRMLSKQEIQSYITSASAVAEVKPPVAASEQVTENEA